jgi:outer membrane autotransporter protein
MAGCVRLGNIKCPLGSPDLSSVPLKPLLLGVLAIGGILAAGPASAACVNTSRGIAITGSTAAEGQPVAGESVTCDATSPNPFPFGIVTTTGQANISVTIGSGAIINAPGSGVLLDDTSTIVNNGTVNTTGVNGFGLSKQFMGSITNNGTVTTSGQTAHGLRSLGGFGTITNNGTVTVSGTGASGVFTSVNETIVNTGTIQASGDGGNGVFMLGGSNFTNSASGIVTATSGTGVLGSGSNFRVSNAGTIVGGNGTAIQLIGGTNFIDVTGGEITGDVLTGAGVDTFTWSGGGTIEGQIVLGDGNDIATLRDLTDGNLGSTTLTDGGLGNDTLTWENVQGSHPERLVNWEEFNLLSGSVLTMGGDLVLGDSATGTGSLTIDGASTLIASQGQYAITPFSDGEATTVTNAGTIDMTSGGSSVTDTLTIAGNYQGQNGSLLLNTVLSGDGAPSDRLIGIGDQSGLTRIFVTNVGGTGDQTTGDGILVDEVIGGVSADAFVLGGIVAAGAYEYRLVHGGAAAGTENNWYLVSHTTDTDGDGDGDVDGDDNDGNPDSELPIYRPEVPIHAVVPAVGRALDRAILGTFHEREGEQTWSARNEGFEAAWLRGFGMRHKQSWDGDLDPTFDGDLWGFQAGVPAYLREHENGQRDVFGLFAGFGRATGDVSGFALGSPDQEVGHLSTNSYNVGGYWTHHWPNKAYVDGVLMFSWLASEARSNRGISADIDGTGITGSIEAGIPFDITPSWQIEPQGQIIWQHQAFDGAHDQFSTIDIDSVDAFTGRLGARLVGSYLVDDVPLRPFAKANIWHEFSGDDTLIYNGFTELANERGGTALEVGVGLTADFSEKTSLYANVDYSTDIGGSGDLDAFEGRLGLRVSW